MSELLETLMNNASNARGTVLQDYHRDPGQGPALVQCQSPEAYYTRVTPVRLYRPDPKDWYRDVMRFLNRYYDWQCRLDDLNQRIALLDAVSDPDEELICYRQKGTVYKK